VVVRVTRDGWAFEDWVARRGRCSPDATALVDAHTGERWRYAALDRAVGETAARLAKLGVAPGDHLGTLLDTRVATVRVVHAAARLGAVLVPLNAALHEEAVARQAEAADVTALVCGADTEDPAVAATGAGGDEGPASVPVASVDDPSDPAVTSLGTVPAAETVEPVRRGLDDTAMVLFTSGTTGDPKAVVLTAGNLLASATASAFRLGVAPGDRWLCELPAYHMGGIAPLIRSAVYGTTAVVQERGDGFDAEATLSNLREYDATGVSLVPTQLGRLLDAGSLPDSLRFVLLGGGPAPAELVERCADRGVPVHPTYGTTETASQIATARPGEAAEYPETVGRPLSVTDVTVVGPEGDPVPAGEAGEIVVAGPTVTPGYYGDEDATAAAFDEYGLHTGDRGYRDDGGRLYVLGRIDDRILTGGETVDPRAVARAVRAVEGVADAAVVGVEDQEWGERVAALVVPEAGADLDVEGVRRTTGTDLAAHEVPKSVAFVDALPRTASGTVDREAAREAIRAAE
jgi:O-succinylbenzoic acid--CoA ligase